MSIFSIILIVLTTVFVMEWVAWSSHKYIMHGWGWGWHRDHHEPHDHALEKMICMALSAQSPACRCLHSAAL